MHMTSTKISMILALLLVLLFSFPFSTVTSAQGGGPGGIPNVKVTNITFSNDNPKEGETITITALVWTNSSRNLTGLTVTFAYDGINITTVKNVSVNANSVTSVPITWKTVKWTHTMTAIVSIDTVPLPKSVGSAVLKVKADPIGDPWTPLGGLIAILITIVIAVAFPSILNTMKMKKLK
jgi:hypothetical protein